MCGIAGFAGGEERGALERVKTMLASIRHRGPDEFGAYVEDGTALGSARLSIIDLATGSQPISNEDGTLWIVFNGEIFNYVELRPELEARGHRFATHSDTEVLLHLYEEFGPACLERLNGQFAFAIWDRRDRSLFLARDRMGIRPLYYTQAGRALVFASEVKALLAHGGLSAEIDPVSLDQIFVFWSTLPGRSAFRGIRQVPPGHYLVVRGGETRLERYWQLQFDCKPRAAGEAREELRALLIDATLVRLRADVPVGAYLSGGLDSSTISAIVRRHAGNRLETFSVAFSDPQFDESGFQRSMAAHLGTEHHVVDATHAAIGRVFPDVVWHMETPVMRTSPAPLFLLSRLVRERGYKVVLTGEGADEVLGGYDIFKEALIRRFWARQPESKLRPRLLERIYADIPGLADNPYAANFFRAGLEDTACPYYSHAVRWRNNSRTRRFFSDEVREAAGDGPLGGVPYPPEYGRWGPLARAQYLESAIFLSGYLLSSQGDRVAMAHSVESRMPFLDYRLVEFAGALPENLKIRVLRDKHLLREMAREYLPAEILARPKRPYRAPIHRSFFCGGGLDYVTELLSPERIREAGLFHPQAVSGLVKKIGAGLPVGETDEMALAGVLSAQLTHHQFVREFRPERELPAGAAFKVCGEKVIHGV